MRPGTWRCLAVTVGAAVGLTIGCGGDPPKTPSKVDAAPAEPDGVANQEVRQRALRGLCVVGHEVRTFIPCGSKKVYWIQADQASLDAFEVAIERFTDEPYEPFYAEIDGRLSDEKGDGFAADYDGQFFVERLIRLAPAGELDCDR